MTLVIAQKNGNKISFSSDSRISFRGISKPFDYGIKVFSVPVKIYSPIDSKTGNQTLNYDYSLGLAVCGNAINAYTVKEFICEILQNLQYIPIYEQLLSIDGIATLVSNVLERISRDMGEIFDKDGLCQLVLGGFCPTQEKVKVFWFDFDISNFPITVRYSEILKNEGDIEFFGTGSDEAKNIYATNNRLTSLDIIKQVVSENKVDSVGGALQFGEFENDNNFKIFGIAECESVNGNPQDSYQLRGMSLYKDELEKGTDGLFVSYTCKMPFEEERKEIFDKLLWGCPKC